MRLDCEIDQRLLRAALEDVLLQFPTFKTKLKAGYAWYKLLPNDAPVPVFAYDGNILAPLDKRLTGGYLFRMSVDGRDLHLDMFHGLTDGNGALSFMLATVARLRQLMRDPHCALPPSDDPALSAEKSEDAFLRYYKPIKLRDLDLKGMAGIAPHRRVGTFADGGYGHARYTVSSPALMSDVKANDASFTAYLAGLTASCVEALDGGKKPIVLMIPVNLRLYFPSQTQRNFVLFARIVIHPSKCATLADYICEAKAQLATGLQKDRLLAQLSTTVKGMTNALMSVVPLFVKKAGARVGRLFMRSRQTMILSNLGRLQIPDDCGVQSVCFNLNVSKNNVQNMAVTTYRDQTTFSFTSAIEEEDLQNKFAEALASRGLNVVRSDD